MSDERPTLDLTETERGFLALAIQGLCVRQGPITFAVAALMGEVARLQAEMDECRKRLADAPTLRDAVIAVERGQKELIAAYQANETRLLSENARLTERLRSAEELIARRDERDDEPPF
jgi:hypothetical protein